MVKTDKKRASYYNYYSSKKWGDTRSYDLCINRSAVGVDGAVKMIRAFAETKQEWLDVGPGNGSMRELKTRRSREERGTAAGSIIDSAAVLRSYSTVTDFARFLGWSTSRFLPVEA